MSIGKSNRGSDVGHGAWFCFAHVLPRGQTLSSDEIHNGYNNIFSYPLEHDDKITFSRGDQEWLTAGSLGCS
jgi:hypothetical protein